MANEQPAYTVIRVEDDFEIRRYKPYLVAEVDAGSDFEEAGSRAFNVLAGFIFGKNASAESIGMTAPVTQSPKGETIGMTAPVTQRIQPGAGYMISFFMPSRYTLANLPRPLDERIRIRQVPATLMAVRRYRGGWSEKLYRNGERTLLDAIAGARLKVLGSPVWARYNAPFWPPPPLRRNEILVEIAE